MPTHIEDKLRRAALIHLDLLEQEKVLGRLSPSPYAWLQPYLRLVKGDGPWSARIIEDSFIATARISKHSVGTKVLKAPGWTGVEIHIQGRCRLEFSIREGMIILHRYEPGLWEGWFGVDHGSDTTPLLPDLFADDKDPRWRAFKASGLSEWPPRFDASELRPNN